MTGRALAVAALLLGASGAGAQSAPPPGTGITLGGRFRLSVTSGPAPSEASEGALYFFPDGRVCVRVERPLRQDVLIARDRVLFHYPDRALVLEAALRPGQAPPVMEALVAGLAEPSQLLPANARLASRTRDTGALRTRWTLEPASDGVIEVVETAEGIRSFELRDADGTLRRRLDFGGRTRVGRLRVPTTVRGEFAPRRGEARTELWTLTDLSPVAPATVAADCAGSATATRREPLAW